ncbi:redoxin domain-containing protein [Maritimibacter sp. DP07]|uniref:Alkyl hydroperoxide reductase C n=1 Tax=Maritimibacter harenae TaxID=2606218 RepID=A0A845M1M7_9RHOB|nr:redoxin domain-containing protein [Maritimibacter harenae]MZR11423.1 redoxin domain-containing protein [Maritimibacter harenae]
MTFQFFAPRGTDGALLRVPQSFRRSVKWLPQIGDIFPDFTIETTLGPLNFRNWAEGSWVYLFSHPAAHTPVCTTEVGSIAMHWPDFEGLGAKVLGFTSSSVDEQLEWHGDIQRLYGVPVCFPTANDLGGAMAKFLGMRHEKEHKSWPIRKSFVLDPEMKIRAIFEYPIYIGRSTAETLRVIKALQLVNQTGAATPADWTEFDPIIIDIGERELEVVRKFGAVSRQLLPYLRLVRGDKRHEIPS